MALTVPIYDILIFRFRTCQKKHEIHIVSESLWKYKATLLHTTNCVEP